MTHFLAKKGHLWKWSNQSFLADAESLQRPGKRKIKGKPNVFITSFFKPDPSSVHRVDEFRPLIETGVHSAGLLNGRTAGM
ncbi:hypothetical protein [Shewanella spartinae]|uniref:hypothetical protein n=1 Tax=Shewanella spartinae TaxID=2864205 RepID=UPI001C656125|nr:hypothetical protein [Shewanella spartinae]QYJ95482.1 hypothetical protein K0I31_09025 [Shewanella spartinae]